jgi:hypothetical protein
MGMIHSTTSIPLPTRNQVSEKLSLCKTFLITENFTLSILEIQEGLFLAQRDNIHCFLGVLGAERQISDNQAGLAWAVDWLPGWI